MRLSLLQFTFDIEEELSEMIDCPIVSLEDILYEL